MNITIIGAGNMGRGIGTRAAAGGHSVTFVDANPEAAEKTAAEVRALERNRQSLRMTLWAYPQDALDPSLNKVIIQSLNFGIYGYHQRRTSRTYPARKD